MGISLGGLELATDYLFANTDLYEPELTEIKSTISNKPAVQNIKVIKPVKPKLTRENIIERFSIQHTKPVATSDEVLDISDEIVVAPVSFDESLDIFNETTDESKETQNNSEESAALDLYSRLQENNSMTFEDNENSLIEDDLDEVDETENADEDDLDSMLDYVDLDGEDDPDQDLDAMLDGVDFGDDEFGFESEEEEPVTKATIPDIATPKPIDPIVKPEVKQPETIVVESTSDDADDALYSELESEFEEDGDEEEDEQDIDSMLDGVDFGDIGLEDEDLDTEDEEPVIEQPKPKPKPVENKVQPVVQNVQAKQEVVKENKSISDAVKAMRSAPQNKENSNAETEIQKLKEQIASMNKEIQGLHESKASQKTSELREVNNKKVAGKAVEASVPRQKPVTKTDTTKNIQGMYRRYSTMTTDELYKLVKNYMITNGVSKKPIELSNLYLKFGEANIKGLIQKSYLIKVQKGVTIGR